MRATLKIRTVPTGRSMADEAVRLGAIDLAQGVLHAPPPKVLIELLAEVAREPRAHGYASPQGVPAYLEALVDLLRIEGVAVAPEHVLGSYGNTGGLLSALIAHCQPEDRVLLPEPFYPAHEWAIRAARCEPAYIRHTESLEVDRNDLVAQLNAPGIRAILVTNPSNPSGHLWPEDLLRDLLHRAEKRDLLVIVDETYKDYVWEGQFVTPLTLTTNWDQLVVLRSFSKTLAIAGWRAGYTVSAPHRIAAMTHRVHDALYVGAPSLPQYVLAKALRENRAELDAFVKQNAALYGQSRTALADVFRDIGMEPTLPHGAFYMLVKHNRASDLAATKELLDRGVAVAPGGPFFRPQDKPTGFIRIHFAVSPETVAEVRQRLLS